MSSALVDDSYRCAAQVARRAGSNFFRSFALLPHEKQLAMTALYAFARQTDDLADAQVDAGDLLATCRTLEAWRAMTARALLAAGHLDSAAANRLIESAAPARLPNSAANLLPAMADTARRFVIPPQYLIDLIDGVLADQTQTRFHSFEQLEHYCYQVASTVGLACIQIWGHDPPLPYSAAVDCGVAFQLTNILRDLREDAERGRIYLPREFWGGEEIAITTILAKQPSANLLAAIDQLSARARARYQSGWSVFASLHPDGQPMFSMMWRTYRLLHCKLDRNPTAALRKRLRLGWTERLALASSHFVPRLFRRLDSPLKDPRFQESSE
ncbi:phytoene/squalene synthase family protein [Planctomycetaceae bacterium SH139]